MRFLYIIIFSIAIISCKKTPTENTQHGQKIIQNSNSKISLGEDIEEINAYPKKIYKANQIIYIDIDLVKIEYKNIDEKVIVNKNHKIRTYIINENTLIYSGDCKTLTADEFFQNRQLILNSNANIAVGQSKNGKMISINFGCYG